MLSSDKSALKFYLTRSVSISHAAMGRHEEAIKEVDNAIQALPENWKDDDELADYVEAIYEEKASYLSTLERPDDAIDAYNSSKGVRPQNSDNGYFLDDVTRIWTELRDPDGQKLFNLLQSWTDKERLAWFGYIFVRTSPF
jgi:tetratricopeptide (TPR) repeat protein